MVDKTQQCRIEPGALRFQAVDLEQNVLNSVSIENALGSDVLEFKSLDGTPVELRGVLAPVHIDSAANKGYVDSLVCGIRWLGPVAVATVDNVELSALIPGALVDEYALAVGDRVLVRAQAVAKDNGIYIVQVAGPPLRAPDLAVGAQAANVAVFVTSGKFESGGFVCAAQDDSAVVVTDDLVFVQFTGSTPIRAGSGITKIGATLAVAPKGITSSLIDDGAVTSDKLSVDA